MASGGRHHLCRQGKGFGAGAMNAALSNRA